MTDAWAAWAKRNARRLRGPHPTIEEIRQQLAPDPPLEPLPPKPKPKLRRYVD